MIRGMSNAVVEREMPINTGVEVDDHPQVLILLKFVIEVDLKIEVVICKLPYASLISLLLSPSELPPYTGLVMAREDLPSAGWPFTEG